MRIGVFLLLAGSAAAQSGPAQEMRDAFWGGLDISVAKAFNEQAVRAVARRPETALDVCRYAVDTSHMLGVVHHLADKALATADRVRHLAHVAMERDDGLASRWAVIEARIYREKLLERMAGTKIRLKFPPKPPTADHPERWKRYTDAIAALARAGAESERAVEGVLRAIEFQLQACHLGSARGD